jgi:hypothetical protein
MTFNFGNVIFVCVVLLGVGGTARADSEIERINQKISQIEFRSREVFSRTAMDIKFDTRTFEGQIAQQIKAHFKNRADAKSIADLVPEITKIALEKFKKESPDRFWRPGAYHLMKVKSIYDLGTRRGTDVFKSLVDYFNEQYALDISPVRIFLMDGMNESERGIAVTIPLTAMPMPVTVPTVISGDPVTFEGEIVVSHFDSFLTAIAENVYERKDILFLSATLHQNLPNAALATAAHEVRHLVDGWSKSESLVTRLAQSAKSKKLLRESRILADDKVEYENSVAFTKWSKAIELKRNKNWAAEITADLLATFPKSTEQFYVENETDVEIRGWWEEFRYARLKNNKTEIDIIKTETYSIPFAMIDRTEAESNMGMIDGKPYCLWFPPAYPYYIRFFQSIYRRSLEKVPRT